MFEKLIELLKKQEIEVTDPLKENLQKFWADVEKELKPDTGGLFTQEELNDHIQKRLARERAANDAEIKSLQEKVEKLVEPEKMEEVKSEFENQITSVKSQREKDIKNYEMKLAATKAGAKDEDYIIYQAEKKGLSDKLGFDEEGRLVLVDGEGNPEKDEEGNLKGVDSIIKQFQEELPEQFSKDDPKTKKQTAGATLPISGENAEILQEERRKRAKEFAESLGYKKKSEGVSE